jgi:hypothetical protein
VTTLRPPAERWHPLISMGGRLQAIPWTPRSAKSARAASDHSVRLLPRRSGGYLHGGRYRLSVHGASRRSASRACRQARRRAALRPTEALLEPPRCSWRLRSREAACLLGLPHAPPGTQPHVSSYAPVDVRAECRITHAVVEKPLSTTGAYRQIFVASSRAGSIT